MATTRILLIDDSAGATHLLKRKLEQAGDYVVKEENNGARAFEAAVEFQPDLIVCDVCMPEMDGGSVAAGLQGDSRVKDIPIVFLTSLVSKADGAPGQKFGGFPFLAKPVDIQDLISCVQRTLAQPAAVAA
ncbi:MAG TPA: response regulator [Chthoniobacteraceae bacterium]|jgi:CheY-like chemotaxis protein